MNSHTDKGRGHFTSRHVCDTRYACPMLERIIATPDRIMGESSQVLKHDRTTTVVKVDDNDVAWVVKRYNTKNAWHALRRTLRRSRALNCWEMSAQFLAAGITVPARVAYIEEKLGPLRGRSYFLYEYVDAEDLISYMQTHNRPGDLEFVLRKIEDLFAALRASRVNHGDMKATNILVSADRSVTLLDLDAARRPADAQTFERGYVRDRTRFLKNWHHDPDLLDRFESVIPE